MANDIDIRLICATNQPLQEMVQQSEFRQDLLYRINTIELHLPPLRDRKEDIPLLADHFLKVYARKYDKDIEKLDHSTYQKLQDYNWPGNVRELQHALERAIIMADGNTLMPDDFLLLKGSEETMEQFVFEDYNLEEVEKMVLRKALDKHVGNISKAADELGLTRASLYRRMDKYGL